MITEAPDFELENQDGKRVKLSQYWSRGPVLIAFYPGDFTPVCTKQLCGYQNSVDDFSKLGIAVLGISSDSSESHRRFKAKHGLTFDLLTDPDHEAARAFGATSKLLLGNV